MANDFVKVEWSHPRAIKSRPNRSLFGTMLEIRLSDPPDVLPTKPKVQSFKDDPRWKRAKALLAAQRKREEEAAKNLQRGKARFLYLKDDEQSRCVKVVGQPGAGVGSEPRGSEAIYGVSKEKPRAKGRAKEGLLLSPFVPQYHHAGTQPAYVTLGHVLRSNITPGHSTDNKMGLTKSVYSPDVHKRFVPLPVNYGRRKCEMKKLLELDTLRERTRARWNRHLDESPSKLTPFQQNWLEAVRQAKSQPTDR